MGLPPEVIAAWERGVAVLLANPASRRWWALRSPAFRPHADYVFFIDVFAAEAEAYLRSTGTIR
jgi:hypothetical protein